MKSRTPQMKRLMLILWLASLCIPQSGWGQQLTAVTWIPGVPKDDSPNKKGDIFTTRVQFADPNNKGQVITDDITVNIVKWDGKEAPLLAQQRKAKAFADAINNAKLNGVSATLSPDSTLVFNRFTRTWVSVPLAQSVTVNGLAIDPKNKKGPVWGCLKDPTKEPHGGTPPPPWKGTYTPSMGGTGSGLSTGVDPDNAPSLLSFGFYTEDGQTIDVATLIGAAGQTESEIMTQLASLFNSLYSQSGFTAYFDAVTDTLTFDRPLNSGQQIFFIADTDTGVEFQTLVAVDDGQ